MIEGEDCTIKPINNAYSYYLYLFSVPRSLSLINKWLEANTPERTIYSCIALQYEGIFNEIYLITTSFKIPPNVYSLAGWCRAVPAVDGECKPLSCMPPPYVPRPASNKKVAPAQPNSSKNVKGNKSQQQPNKTITPSLSKPHTFLLMALVLVLVLLY
jgi:hypothetical protein